MRVVAAHQRSDKTDEFLGSLRQCAVIVRARIEIEESLDSEMPRLENLVVHLAPEFVELMDAVDVVHYTAGVSGRNCERNCSMIGCATPASCNRFCIISADAGGVTAINGAGSPVARIVTCCAAVGMSAVW